MTRLLRIVAVAAAVGLALPAISLWGVYRAACQAPDFYQDALRLEPSQQKAAGNQLEQQVLELHNEARQEGMWQVIFTDEQLNGWLAVDLPQKFSRLFAPEVKEPRVALKDDLAQIAWRYQGRTMDTIVSLTLEVQLTEEPNVVAIRVVKARAGVLPMPLKQFLDPIAQAAHDADISLRWLQTEGDPVALVTIPSEHEEYQHHNVRLEKLELRQGELYLAGRTERIRRRPPEIQQAALHHGAANRTRHR